MKSQAQRLDALTGLRFIAAAAVFLFHAPSTVVMAAFQPGGIGPAAVGCFFVLSGFILAHVYRRQGAPLASGPFLRARFARIWPLHAACLLIVFAIQPALLPTTGIEGLRALAHLALLQGWSWDASWILVWNGPSWSLSVEAFFYALFPLLASCRGRTLAGVYLACLVGNASVYALAEHVVAKHGGDPAAWGIFTASFPVFRLQEFVLGVCVHAAWRAGCVRLPPSAGAITVFELLALVAVATSFRALSAGGWGPPWVGADCAPLTVAALACGPGMSWAFVALIVLLADGRGLLARVLATRPFVYLGEISFALYLVHTPVFMLLGSEVQPYELLWPTPLALCGATALAVASWLHAVIETPARQAILAGSVHAAARLQVYAAQAVAGASRPGVWLLTVVALGAFGIGRVCRPDTRDFAAGIVGQSSAVFRGVSFGERVQLLGATMTVHGGEMKCWLALASTEASAPQVAVEARSADGRCIALFPLRTQSVADAMGRITSVHVAAAALPSLAGASVIALVVREAGGAIVSPVAGPALADGDGLELLRIP